MYLRIFRYTFDNYRSDNKLNFQISGFGRRVLISELSVIFIHLSFVKNSFIIELIIDLFSHLTCYLFLCLVLLLLSFLDFFLKLRVAAVYLLSLSRDSVVTVSPHEDRCVFHPYLIPTH